MMLSETETEKSVVKSRAFVRSRCPHLFVGEDDPTSLVQCGLEGETSQAVVVLQVDVVPLHNQSSSLKEKEERKERVKTFSQLLLNSIG